MWNVITLNFCFENILFILVDLKVISIFIKLLLIVHLLDNKYGRRALMEHNLILLFFG